MKIRPLHDPRNARRGAVLAMSLLVMIPLAALTFALVTTATAFQNEKRTRTQDEQAYWLAEAGIDEGITALVGGGTGAVATQAAPAYLGGGMIWVERDDIGNRLLRLSSHALFRSGRSSVEQLVFVDQEDMANTAIFSNMPLTMDSNVFIDSFDSALGTYASQVSGGRAGEGAVIESNDVIGVDSAGEVYGDLHPGPESSVTMSSNVTLTGVTQPLPSNRTIPVEPIPVIPSLGSLVMVGTPVYPPGDWGFADVEVDGDVTIQGPARVVMDSLELRSNSSLTFDTATGPIELYVRNNLVLSSNSDIVTTAPAATEFTLNFYGAHAVLSSNASFYGRIVAPYGTVEIRSNFEVYGAVLANEVMLASNTRLHYDQALLGLGATDPTYIRSTWSRIAFPVDALRVNRRDPFAILGLDPTALALPAQAHGMP